MTAVSKKNFYIELIAEMRKKLDYMQRRISTRIKLDFLAGVADSFSGITRDGNNISNQFTQYRAFLGAQISATKLND